MKKFEYLQSFTLKYNNDTKNLHPKTKNANVYTITPLPKPLHSISVRAKTHYRSFNQAGRSFGSLRFALGHPCTNTHLFAAFSPACDLNKGVSTSAMEPLSIESLLLFILPPALALVIVLLIILMACGYRVYKRRIELLTLGKYRYINDATPFKFYISEWLWTR